MNHSHYYQIEAEDHRDAGRQAASLFSNNLLQILEEEKRSSDWSRRVQSANRYLRISRKYFPEYMSELTSYADASGVTFQDLWCLALEDEGFRGADRCTTVVSGDSLLVGHNEDWDYAAKDQICVLKKTTGNLTQFGLYYLHTPGGNSLTVNSHGLLLGINSLPRSASVASGLPKNIVARWISDAPGPEHVLKHMTRYSPASGYHHTMIQSGMLTSLETSAGRFHWSRPSLPFCHTNHYLLADAVIKSGNDDQGSVFRYNQAQKMMQAQMTPSLMQDLLNTGNETCEDQVFNRNTIAKIVVDLKEKQCLIWLLREKEKGWITYSLEKLF